MIVSAADLTRTRLCRAELCPNEAENYSRLCWRCERQEALGRAVKPHTAEPVEPKLYCSVCGEWKPDDDFAHRASVYHIKHRRGRYQKCRECDRMRLREYRARLRREAAS